MRLAFVIAIAGALTEAVVVYAIAVPDRGRDDALALSPWDAAAHAGADGRRRGARRVTLVSLVGGLRSLSTPLPRLANAFLVEGRVYPLYGFHHGMQQIVAGRQQFAASST